MSIYSTTKENLSNAVATNQEKFESHLLSLPKEEILQHVYECAVRRDIVYALEDLDLSTCQRAALLRSPDFISEVYKAFNKVETDYMEILEYAIESAADEYLKKHPEITRNMPLCTDLKQAEADDAVEDWEESGALNDNCVDAIESAIRQQFGNRVVNPRHHKANAQKAHEALMEVMERYSIERICYVLSVLLRAPEMDKSCVSANNMEWASENPHSYDVDVAGIWFRTLDVHPSFIELFATEAQAVEKSMLLLNQFSWEEFGYDAEIDDLSKFSICVCDSATDEALYAEVYLNLVELKIERWLNGVRVDEVRYKNMDELNDDLEALNIESLVSFAEKQIRKALDT